jgi:multidrug resistance efflux pump
LLISRTRVASGESAKDQLASTKAALKQLSEAAEAATAKCDRAELEVAEANLHRQQQMLKLGVAGKSDMDRAEEKLTELKAQKH